LHIIKIELIKELELL